MIRTIFSRILIPACTLISGSHAAELIDAPSPAGVSIPKGTALKIEADFKNQQLASPTALAFDEQGRVLVTETHRFAEGIEDDRAHLYWYLDDLAAMTTKNRRALHEKWKEKLPLERMTAKSGIVRRLADTNGDGSLDESKVFADGFNDVPDGTASGIYSYEGTVYLGCIPKLLALRDKDGDGRADERKTIEEGFGVRVSLSGHDLGGFALGPDGRIYGTIGDRGFSITTKEGKALNYPNQGAVFRFEPDGTGFELVHTGLRNPREIAFDALGYPFTVDNSSDQGDAARIVYVVEGGDSGWEMENQAMFPFHRQIGLEELPPNRWMEEKMWHIANPDQPAYIVPAIANLTSSPSGLTFHPGAGFLEEEAGRFLICDYRGGAANSGIHSFAVKPDGAGMKMTDSHKLLWGVAATDVEYSWDGRVFVTDFTGGWKAHDDGRLLSLDAGPQQWRADEAVSSAKIVREGFEQRSAAELANLLRHPDARIRLRAQLALSRKPDAMNRFSDATMSSDFMVRVHGIWGLGIIARRGSALLPANEFSALPSVKLRKEAGGKLTALLTDKNGEIRCQALRALADAGDGAPPLPLGPLLADPSPRIRYFAAIIIGKRRMIDYYGPVCDMLAENDNRDPYLRHAGVFALEHMAPSPDVIRALSTHASAAVRLAAVVALRRMKSPDVVDFVRDADPKVADEAIRAICDTDLTSGRPAIAALMDQLDQRAWTPFMLRRLLHNSFRLGDAENAARVFKFAADSRQPEALRKEAFRLLTEWTKPFPADQLTGHWRPLPERAPKLLAPLLAKELPALLAQDGFVLSAALSLIDIHQIKIASLDLPALRRFVENPALPPEARSKALDLIARRKPAGLEALLWQTIRDAPDEVALTALRHLAKLSPQATVAPLEAALAANRPLLARGAWDLLAGVPGAAADALFVKHLDLVRASNGISPYAIELMDAAGKRQAPPVAAALAALEKSFAENPDPLAKWNIALEGGDAEAGHAIFVSHPAAECMRCHRGVGGSHDTGGDTAPNLAGAAKRHPDRRYFLESLLTPSAAANTVSPMPPMGELLKPGELRDVIAWLGSLTDGSAAATTAAEPEPFDPAAEAGKPGLTEKDPLPPVPPAATAPPEEKPISNKYDNLTPTSTFPAWIPLIIIAVGILMYLLLRPRSKSS